MSQEVPEGGSMEQAMMAQIRWWENRGALGLPPLVETPSAGGIPDTWSRLWELFDKPETPERDVARALQCSNLLRRLSGEELGQICGPEELTTYNKPPPWLLVWIGKEVTFSQTYIDQLTERWPYQQNMEQRLQIVTGQNQDDLQRMINESRNRGPAARQRILVVCNERLEHDCGSHLLRGIKDSVPDRWLMSNALRSAGVIPALQAGDAMGFLPTDEGLSVAARIWQRMNDPIPEALQTLAFVEPGPHRAAQYQRLADAWLRFGPEERNGPVPLGPAWALQAALLRERDALLAEIGDQPYYTQ